jgi:polar amino acid transport system substrate-binding protein
VLIGFEVDIAESIARRLGVKARFAQCQWANLVPTLERGDFDVVMNGLEATAERRDRLLLSRPYFAYVETLAVRRGAPYRSLDDLAKKRVATLDQTFAFQTLQRRPEIELTIYEGVQEPYDDLEHGRVDGVLLENIIAQRYGCDRPKLECIDQAKLRGVYAIGIRKTDARLKEAIDRALAAMIAEGELERILRKWKIWDDSQTSLASGALPEEEKAPAARFGMGQMVLFLEGAGYTLAISVAAFALAVPIALLLATLRLFGKGALRVGSAAYTEIFRGTPVLLQLYVLYYGLASVVNLSPLVAAVLGLGLNYAAYEGEVYRGAISAIPRGQSEAAAALGLTRTQTLRYVLLPQAFRNALPAMTNDFVALLKDSSLVSVITVVELTKRMTITAVETRGWLVPGLACAALYFAMSFPLARLARRLEKRLTRDQDKRAL